MQAHEGIIQGVRIALGIGTIRPNDGGDDVQFGRDALIEGAFEELREGQAVSYALGGDASASGERRARQILVLAE
jgi:cold shock CspA family protein